MLNKVTPLHGNTSSLQTRPRRARVIAVTSGKGGVGKTNITTNLAIGLAQQGQRVCVFDADTGLANINILLGLTPRYTLEQLFDGSQEIDELLIDGPGGMKIIPGASGIARIADLDRHSQQVLFNSLQRIESQFDYLLLDTAAGIADSVVQFVKAAEQAIVVLSPDPTSLTDAFALSRLLLRQDYSGGLNALVNMAEGAEAARRIFNRFSQAVNKYLHTSYHYLGHVSADRAVVSAVRLQHPVMLVSPESAASRCLQQLASAVHKKFSATPGKGLAQYWREQQQETPVDTVPEPATIVPTATQSVHETSLDQLNRQFVNCIQGNKGDAEEFIAAIKPIIDAYVARFRSFPLDMREAVSKYLEVADFPEQEIRKQLTMLEQLYEEHFQRPLMDKEDSLFRLLQQVRDSEAEFSSTIERLQESYENQYRPEAGRALDRFLARLDALDISANEFEDCINAMKAHYRARFGSEVHERSNAIGNEVRQLGDEFTALEGELQNQLVSLTRLITRSQEGLRNIQALQERLSFSPGS